MIKGIKNFLEILKFVEKYQRFLRATSKEKFKVKSVKLKVERKKKRIRNIEKRHFYLRPA